ncbi:cell elongation-specific peptidoglycan biosynthesis regulator RodA [Desulforamulus reducens MI-1]|uniref:Cell elongation-specific peptidoglycan biosynthesis regulator RodA n=1 Tax=Desulforamulus reducens (strain ATCC BAA-1160 / DSM 100696 / MI-1) TaxID=349161 RepID=A4J586_DESRM|nr:FtsW/RodA/SpoVE family cell cycle protein [Desulforamulus reducens]ABO50239.1 cell elongation-specific peptidoglycan biosynthesis regulator RodA [Desulforamulus reducens MI-1]
MLAHLRKEERSLLQYITAFLAVGIMILYLGKPELTQIYELSLSSGTKLPFWWFVVFLSVGTMAGFYLVSIYWKLLGFRCDPFLMPLTAALTSLGLIFLFRLRPQYAERQFAWLLIGLLVLVIVTTVLRKMDRLADYKYIYVAVGVILLIIPIFFGQEQYGARSWLNLGIFQIQPSEFVKILLVLFLASFLAENQRILTTGNNQLFGISIPGIREIGPLVGMWGISLLILVFQRDLGTALIYFCTFLAMIYAATARLFYVLLGLLMFLIGGTFAYHIFSHVQARVDIWLNPWIYMEGSGYQIIQSLFALGSGGLFGSGLGEGLPNLIPAVHTDFIFSAIVEELGLLGGCAVLVLYMCFIFRGLMIALACKDDFFALVTAGLTVLMGFQTFIIIAGVIKLLPMTGVTLPFISYGGSSLIANFVILGIILNISHEVNGGNDTEH